MEKLSPEQQERLQEYLETRKISKYRIAHDLNLSASTISNYLTGKTKPDGIKWELFRNYLGISEEWIRTGQNMVSTSPKKTPAPNSVEAAVEEIRLMFQTRDDQYMNLHKDLEKLFRMQQELLTTLSALLPKLKK
jgi:transcriptional regulator with XRE-family HTH domain